MIRTALTIAGSDSGGGAGIQADLKTFSAFRVYGTSVITAVTAQNTVEVLEVFPLPREFVALQLDAVLSDLPPDAVKTGMLAGASIIEAAASKIREYKIEKLVVDPVLLSTSGSELLDPCALDALRVVLLPLALIATPNTEEASALAGIRVRSVEEMQEAAAAIHRLGPRYVLVKGGHVEGSEATDVLFDGREFCLLTGPRVDTRDSHGTGCVLSAAITAKLAVGAAVEDAVREGKAFVTGALRRSLRIGSGRGPCDPLALEA